MINKLNDLYYSFESLFQYYGSLTKNLYFRAINQYRSRIESNTHLFQCNICGACSRLPKSLIQERDGKSCLKCGSSKRLRTVAAALSLHLEGGVKILKGAKPNKSIIGFGLSDSILYSRQLSSLYAYQNTFYHRSPYLDITNLTECRYESADFVIASDVFEHIPQPIQVAFDNLYKLLKPGGICIFSVPYSFDVNTSEHFPDLFKYKIKKISGKRVLVNETSSGEVQRFDDLSFHGGRGATLELRLFSLPALLEHFNKAGFDQVSIFEQELPEFGILNFPNESSFTVVLKK